MSGTGLARVPIFARPCQETARWRSRLRKNPQIGRRICLDRAREKRNLKILWLALTSPREPRINSSPQAVDAIRVKRNLRIREFFARDGYIVKDHIRNLVL